MKIFLLKENNILENCHQERNRREILPAFPKRVSSRKNKPKVKSKTKDYTVTIKFSAQNQIDIKIIWYGSYSLYS